MRTLAEVEKEMEKNNLESETILRKYMASPTRELKREYVKSIRNFAQLAREYDSVLMTMMAD